MDTYKVTLPHNNGTKVVLPTSKNIRQVRDKGFQGRTKTITQYGKE